MPIIFTLIHSFDHLVPVRVHLTLILCDFGEKKRWRPAGDVQGEIEPDFPFQQADFIGGGEPGLREERTKEDGGIDAMYEEEVEFGDLGGMLGKGCKVDYTHKLTKIKPSE
jgi:hypothetical protein